MNSVAGFVVAGSRRFGRIPRLFGNTSPRKNKEEVVEHSEVIKNRILSGLNLSAAALMMTAGLASAQVDRGAYLITSTGEAVRAAGYGVCVRSSNWTPAQATEQCDPDLLPRKAPPAPPAPVAKPVPPPAPVVKPAPEMKPEVKKPAAPLPFSERVDVPFEFAKADLTADGRTALDELFKELKKGPVTMNVVIVTGHTDKIGSAAYNKKLSEARAQVVRDYLVNTGGLDSKLIFWEGVGPRQPVNVTKFCDAKMNRKQLIDCLAPNRRTTVEVTGTRPKPAPKPAAAKPAAKPAATM
ncbi:MAG: OmpA family protein [Rhodocyclaceae bacterium]|nr:OmpA family protein [Rhodocyclaceae bacterium]MCA3076155.1 OmpA family protein [Rhodocyclaceae bacterium]MCA3089388.1 OmpA family protein [Rhodocyclaceae bacterium]MCA3092949.1 OmpA family protein [Rhodocyclaceae bacterium]MCA3096960.1 OmpA family protein [Rhodocyclaceae bacterium]